MFEILYINLLNIVLKEYETTKGKISFQQILYWLFMFVEKPVNMIILRGNCNPDQTLACFMLYS